MNAIFKNTLSVGLLVMALGLSGCGTLPATGAATWKTPPGATVACSVHPEAPIIASIFTGVQISNPPPHQVRVKVTGSLTLAPLDPGLRTAEVDVRGFVALSPSAQADCRVWWNGRKLSETHFPAEASNQATNDNWYIPATVPVAQIHKTSPNHMTVELSLAPGVNPSLDMLTLDSVDVNAQTSAVPAGP